MDLKEKEELLLRDLSARLPYKVFIHYHWSRERNTIDEDRELYSSDVETLKYSIENPQNDWCEISWKPYLRPMSSMTEEEYKELKSISPYYGFAPYEYISDWCPNYEMIDWLLSHHFDFRGLIEKGLALRAPTGMYE